jgi:hypothetical protein
MRTLGNRLLTTDVDRFYAGFIPLIVAPKFDIGTRVKILGDHPHVGRVGRIESVDQLIVGPVVCIRFEDGEVCYVFPRRHKLEVVK